MTSGAGTLVDLLYTTCGNSPEWRILTHATRGNPPLVEFPRVADKWPKLLATQGNFPKIDHFPASGGFPRVADNTRTQFYLEQMNESHLLVLRTVILAGVDVDILFRPPTISAGRPHTTAAHYGRCPREVLATERR